MIQSHSLVSQSQMQLAAQDQFHLITHLPNFVNLTSKISTNLKHSLIIQVFKIETVNAL